MREAVARIAVYREEEHVVAVVEDLLGAVAVMEVDIKHRDPGTPDVQGALGGDGGIVEEAVAAELVGGGMVAGRAAQAEGRLAARQHMIHRRERHVLAGHGRLEGALADRGVGAQSVVSEPAVDVIRDDATRHGAGRPDPGDRLALAAGGHPVCPAALEEGDIVGIVNRQHRGEAVLGRLTHFAQAALAHALEHQVDAFGAFVGVTIRPPSSSVRARRSLVRSVWKVSISVGHPRRSVRRKGHRGEPGATMQGTRAAGRRPRWAGCRSPGTGP